MGRKESIKQTSLWILAGGGGGGGDISFDVIRVAFDYVPSLQGGRGPVAVSFCMAVLNI